MRNLAIWIFVCSPHDNCEILKFICSLLNQKYFKISFCKSYFWYASFISIHSINSDCSSKRAIPSHSSFSSNCFISLSLSTVSVILGKVVNISSSTVLSLDSRNKSCDKNHIFKSFKISISHLSARDGFNNIFRNVDFHAQFFPIKAILSCGFILRSVSSKRIVDHSCLYKPFIVII
jgi:hypothetical protein